MLRDSLKVLHFVCAGLVLIAACERTEAIIITYSNPGPTDSVVHGGFNNVVQVGQPGYYTTSDFLSHSNVIARFDTAIGHGTFPNTESTATAQVEIGTDLNSPTGTGIRTVFSPITNASFLAARGQTYQPGPNGNYSSQSFVHSGNLSTGTTPTAWQISVLPSVGEVPGTPVDVTIDASIVGSLSVAGTSTADASWNVTTTTHGSVMAGTLSLGAAGTSALNDNGSLTFTIPLGTTFELLVHYNLNTAGAGAGANSFAEVTASTVEVSAVPSPTPLFSATFGQPIGSGTTSASPAGPFNKNRTIPVKVDLRDSNGELVTDAAASALDVRIGLYYDQSQGGSTPAAANPPQHGSAFQYKNNGRYKLNVSTKHADWVKDHSYRIEVEVDGQSAGEAFFSLD